MDVINNSTIDTVIDFANVKFGMELTKDQVSEQLRNLSFSQTLKLINSMKADDNDAFSEIIDLSAVSEGWSVLPSIDREKYQERDGLEGPIQTKSGKTVYYDPKEGKYYDPDSDIYLSYDEWKMLDSENMHKIDMEVPEAYSTGSQGPDDEQQAEPSATDMKAAAQKLKTQRTQAMQRLGRDNLGGATAQMAANAIDNAEQGKVLTPIQRQALAHQAQNLDNLAMNKDTRIQFRNLLNKLRNQTDQEGQ